MHQHKTSPWKFSEQRTEVAGVDIIDGHAAMAGIIAGMQLERQIMLNRIRLLAKDHRKAVLICTHILPDVQSISDSVVILAGGRVQVSEKLNELSRPAVPALEVRLLGDSTRFLTTLRSRGISCEERTSGTLLLHGAPATLADDVWKLASECGVGIRSLTPSRNSLEEIFLNAVRGETHHA